MKRFIYSLLAVVCLTLPVLAQQNAEQIESVKIAFITQRLDLNAQESQQFWPVYNTYQQEMKQLFMSKRKQRQAQKENGTPVDELKFDSDLLELRKRYKTEFSKVLPDTKVTQFYQAERDFRQELIKHLHNRKEKN